MKNLSNQLKQAKIDKLNEMLKSSIELAFQSLANDIGDQLFDYESLQISLELHQKRRHLPVLLHPKASRGPSASQSPASRQTGQTGAGGGGPSACPADVSSGGAGWRVPCGGPRRHSSWRGQVSPGLPARWQRWRR